MKKRIKDAIESDRITNVLQHPFMFSVLLKGGYEDLFSRLLFSNGFVPNKDLTPQMEIEINSDIKKRKIRLDIAQVNSLDNSLECFIEFGHQFSLQFNSNSALDKIKSEFKTRRCIELKNADLYTVQLITDPVAINIKNEEIHNYFINRYRIAQSMSNRKIAKERIDSLKRVIDCFNESNKIPEGVILNKEITNEFGVLNLWFLINGPYNCDIRSKEF